MKEKLLMLTTASLVFGLFCFSQELPAAPADKAVVYFVRKSGLGFAINFSYFDSATLIGKTNGTNYIRYECEPGKHVFWARSENRDFVEAEVEAGKVYFLEAIPEMGAMKTQVNLQPVRPDDQKTMQKIFKLLNKQAAENFTAEQLERDTDKDVIARGLDKYREDKEKGKTITRLDKAAYYSKP